MAIRKIRWRKRSARATSKPISPLSIDDGSIEYGADCSGTLDLEESRIGSDTNDAIPEFARLFTLWCRRDHWTKECEVTEFDQRRSNIISDKRDTSLVTLDDRFVPGLIVHLRSKGLIETDFLALSALMPRS